MEDQAIKTHVENVTQTKKRLQVTVPSARPEKKFEQILSEWTPNAAIPGFRKGKVPRSIIEKKFQEDIRAEVLRSLLPELYVEALKNAGIQPVSEPVIDKIDYDRGKDLSFEAVIDVAPEVPVVKYRKIKLEKKSLKVKDDEVQEVIDKVCANHARFEPEEGRQIREDDYVVIDYSLFVGSKKIEERKAQFVQVTLQEGPMRHFFEQIISTSPGDTIKIASDIPRSVKDKELAGKQGIYHVTIVEIKKQVIPEFSLDLVKQLGEFDSVEAFKEKIHADIVSYKEKLIEMDLQTNLLNKLIELCPVELPETIVEKQAEVNLSDTKRRMLTEGVSLQAVESEEEKIKEAAHFDARKQIHIAYILHGIAQREEITVSDEELDVEIEALAQKNNLSGESLKEKLKKEDKLGSIKQRLLEEKTIAFLLDKVHVKTGKETI